MGVGVWVVVLGLRNKLIRYDVVLERRVVNECIEISRLVDVGFYRSGICIDLELVWRWVVEIWDMRMIFNSLSRVSGLNEFFGMLKLIR